MYTGGTTSVVVATHSVAREQLLLRAVASLRSQRPAPTQVIVAVDHNPALFTRLSAALEGVDLMDHQGVPGASGARNAGARLARHDLLVFVDDDIDPRPGWLRALTAPFEDPAVVGAGGRTEAGWTSGRPSWFPDEFGWVVGASYTGLPTTVAAVRNVWSENMAVRRAAFERVGGFRAGFGKLGDVSRPEDTELCLRVAARFPDTCWIYTPSALAVHAVPRERATLAFFLRRCYWEGAGKVELSRCLGSDGDLGKESSYLMRELPKALARKLGTGHLSQALATVAGVGAAGAGALAAGVGGMLTR